MERINWIPRLIALCWIFWGKKLLTKSTVLEACQTLISSCNHQQPCDLFSYFAIFQTLVDNWENQNFLIRSRRISFNWGENVQLSQKERLLEPIKKVLILLINYLLASVSNNVYSIILVITKIYISSSLFHFSFVIKEKLTCVDCVNWNIYSCFDETSYTKHFDLWIRFVVYIWYYYSFPYEICKFIWFLIW